MKEATGELNVTVIVAISVGILAAFFFGTIWPMIHHNFQSEADCKSATCNCSKETRDANDGKCSCTITNESGEKSEPFLCTYGG